jgi:hypothetical protein
MASSTDGNPNVGDETTLGEKSVTGSSEPGADEGLAFWSSLLQASLSAKTKAVEDVPADTVVSDTTEAETYLDAYRKEEEQKHRQREYMTPALRNIACGWILAVIVILFYQGLKAWGFNLSDKVLITLLTTTSVNVLGLFLIALNYLYPKHGRWRPGTLKRVRPKV